MQPQPMPPPDATCPRHPDRRAQDTCRRCGTFVCSEDFVLLDGSVFCQDCAARPDVDYLEGYRQKYWGKRDGWAWFFGLGGVANVVLGAMVAVGTLTESLPSTTERATALLVPLALVGWGAMNVLYFLGVRAARPGVVAALVFYGVAQWVNLDAAALGLLLVPALVVASALRSVRSRLFFKLEVPRAALKREWDERHNNLLARNARTLGIAGLAIPFFAPLALLTGIIAWRRVDPTAHPPIGRKGSAIAGVVLGALGTLFWGAMVVLWVVNR